jgi:hypothetical protein
VIELFFRVLKSRYRADDMPSSKRHVVESLLYAAIITIAVSRTLLAALRKKLGALGIRVPDERWAALFAELAREILKVVLRRSVDALVLARDLERALRHEAVDPQGAPCSGSVSNRAPSISTASPSGRHAAEPSLSDHRCSVVAASGRSGG